MSENPTETLHLAAERGDLAAVTACLDQGGDPDAPRDRVTAFFRAVRLGHLAVARLLIARGARPEVPGTLSSLYHCARSCPELIPDVLASGVNVDQDLPYLGTALHGAAAGGHADCARRLLAAGAGVDAVSTKPATPLQVAVTHGHAEVCQVLLTHGARIDLREGDLHLDPLEVALAGGHPAVVDVLQAHLGRRPAPVQDLLAVALLQAVARRDPGRIRLWLSREAPVDARDGLGQTALHHAALHDDSATAGLLLEAGAEIDPRDDAQRTPLDLATDARGVVVAQVLRRARQIPPEVEVLRRCLRHDPSAADVARAVALLQGEPRLIRSLTSAEAERLARHAPPGSAGLVARVQETLAPERTLASCERCGRYTVRGGSCDVLHGNLATPASDTEVEWTGTCTSCGARYSERR